MTESHNFKTLVKLQLEYFLFLNKKIHYTLYIIHYTLYIIHYTFRGNEKSFL